MKSDLKCLAVITARGGSKGVPKKNIRPVGSMPLIAHTIELAKQCSFITRLVVSTEDEEIRQVSLRYGAEVPFLRPAELATDTAKQEDAILHAMDWYENRYGAFDYLCLLDPTVPLRQLSTLNRGFESLMARKDAEAIVSVAECSVSPIICNTLRPDGFMKDWIEEKYKWANRQEMPVFYRLCGVIFISKWDAFRKHQTFLHDKAMTFTVDEIEGTDINSPLDFFIVEQLIERGFFNSDHLRQYVKETLAEKK